MAGLFSSFNVGRLALQAQQTALQVVGQNIANANTEGYSRQRAILQTTRPQDMVFAQIGTGVKVAGIERIINTELEIRLQDSFSNMGSLQAQDATLRQIEALFNELSDSDLSSEMGRFFDSLNNLSVKPEDASIRTEVVSRADSLADTFHFLTERLNATRTQINNEVVTIVSDINGMTQQIAQLNNAIVSAENAGANTGSANDLRDKRDLLLKQLSELVDIRAIETNTGAVSVLSGSDFLVFGNEQFALTTVTTADRNVDIARIEFAHNGQDLTIRGGALKGLIESRDVIATEFLDDIGTLASTLITEINQIHSSGRGLKAFTNATSLEQVGQPTQALNQAGLNFTPVNGSFEIVIDGGVNGPRTINIEVDLDGLGGNDTTLNSLVAQINAKAGSDVTASVTNRNELSLVASAGFQFTFANDSSGALAALGVNSFFTGSDAFDIGVNAAIKNDLDLLAAARPTGVFNRGDNSNVQLMLGLRDQKLFNTESTTLDDFYQGMISSLAVQTASVSGQAGNQQVLHTQLMNEREMISGVNIDEETIDLLSHQRAFQAAARYISVIDELLNTLINAT